MGESMDTSTAGQLVAVLGEGVLTQDRPFVHADDLGLTRGDGCFDATLVYAVQEGDPEVRGLGRVLHVERHIRRLARSAAALGIEAPSRPQWLDLLEEALAHESAPSAESALKFVLSRGREEHPGGPLAYLTITPLSADALAARAGLDVVTLTRGQPSDAFADAPWLLGGVKTISYAVNMAAKREAVRRGADEALFVATDGFALEAPTAALIVRRGDQLLTTPTGPTGVLASITVETLYEAASADGFTCAHELLTLDEVRAADGAWLVSSVRGVAPIRHLDGVRLAEDPQVTAHLSRLAGFAP